MNRAAGGVIHEVNNGKTVVRMEKTRSYSGLFIIQPERAETIEEVHNKIKAIISDSAGEVVQENATGKKALAYPINKKSAGVYYEVVFKADPKSVEKITRQCYIDTDIMRAVIDKQGK